MPVHNFLEKFCIARPHKVSYFAGGAKSPCATDSLQEILIRARKVKLDHVVHIDHIESPLSCLIADHDRQLACS